MHDDGASSDLRIGDWVPAQHTAPPDESRPASVARTEAVPAVPGWVASEETVALPAFLRGVPAPTLAATTDPTAPLFTLLPRPDIGSATGRHAVGHGGDPAAHATPDATAEGDGLPASERNMLIFVSSLLAAGTLAIVAMGHGALNKHSSPPAKITPAPTTSGSSGQSFVGSPDVAGYCDGLDGHLTSRPPGSGRTAWTCTGTGHTPVTFTPTDVCRAQYGPSAHAVYTTLTDAKTWRCLR